jgi:hypothetical protein
MDAGKRTIGAIFSTSRALEVPFFQRSYVWGEENWERFLDDMMAISQEQKDYFIGSIILKQKETPSDAVVSDRRTVVDGQQRLTTLTLFFKVLFEAQGKESIEFTRRFFNLDDKPILKHNHIDVAIFEAIVEEKLTEELKSVHSESNILSCYHYFKNNKERIKEINANILFSKIYFVGIDLGKEEDEQQIFDTINSLGVSLTAAELLKNELFDREEEPLFDNTWKAIFEDSKKDYWSLDVTSGRQKRENIDLFLQTYLLLKSGAKEKYTSSDSLFKNYKSYIKENNINQDSAEKEVFVKELIEDAKLYQDKINPLLLNETINPNSNIERLTLLVFGLNITTVIPYIIFIIKNVKENEELDKMLFLLECYLVRRLICKETTKNYNNLFVSWVRNRIDSYSLLQNKVSSSDSLTENYPDDEALIKGIYENNYSNQQARVLLYLIELYLRDNALESTQILGLNSYSLEHIMPKKWQTHWPDNVTESERNQAILKLGNLTLITSSLNSTIRNAGWTDKRDGKGSKKGLKAYSAGLKIIDNGDFLTSPSWNETMIQKRGKFLAESAIALWQPSTESPIVRIPTNKVLTGVI